MDWPLQEVEARFGAFLETCLREAHQVVTRDGARTAVLVSADEWHRLQQAAKPSLKALLLEDENRFDVVLPERSLNRRRGPPALD